MMSKECGVKISSETQQEDMHSLESSPLGLSPPGSDASVDSLQQSLSQSPLGEQLDVNDPGACTSAYRMF